MTDELVSKQAVLVALKDALMAWSYMSEWRDNKIIESINELLPIQPVIVRCKECKHRYVEGDNVRYNTCELNHNNVQSDEWFCADAERREVNRDSND